MSAPAKTSASLSVVVPVHNGAAALEELVARLQADAGPAFASLEIILVNDGSADASWARIQELASRDARVRGIDLMRSYGQHNALLIGIREARGTLIATMDDDLQHPPDQLPLLLAKLSEGHDVVYGVPEHPSHGFWRNLSSWVTKRVLQRVMGAKGIADTSAFRLFRAPLREAFSSYVGPDVDVDVLLSWGTDRFGAVAVRHDPRKEGRSSYTFRKLVRHALTMLTGFSVVPLRLASYIGFAFVLVGLGLFAFVIGRYVVEGGSIPGFPFLASTISLFAGAQLFALGIIGEYLARVHFRVMGRPPAVVRGRTGSRKIAGQA